MHDYEEMMKDQDLPLMDGLIPSSVLFSFFLF